jgi:pyruvate/2-oxoglutarate dehydrogenase complex dihydrolipoamide acyltransferase (E2) component
MAPGEAWPALLARSLQEVPQAASVVEVDLTPVVEHLDRTRVSLDARGIEPSLTAYFAAALLAALKRVPHANATFDAEAGAIRGSAAVHLGLSVLGAGGDAAHAVVRDADTRNLLGLAVEVENVRASATADSAVLASASVTLADYGPDGALYAVPLVLPGQSLAVRVGAVAERLVSDERGFRVAPTAWLCAAIDHRALDGVDAGALLGEMKRFLEQYA